MCLSLLQTAVTHTSTRLPCIQAQGPAHSRCRGTALVEEGGPLGTHASRASCYTHIRTLGSVSQGKGGRRPLDKAEDWPTCLEPCPAYNLLIPHSRACNLPKPDQEEIDNVNLPITKDELIAILKLLQKVEGTLPDSFCEASITLIANQTHYEKRATGQTLANQTQQYIERKMHPKEGGFFQGCKNGSTFANQSTGRVTSTKHLKTI